METLHPAQPHIADYLRPLASRKWLILIAVLVATGGVYAYYAHQPDVYSASTLVFVKDPGDPVTGVPNTQSTDRNVQNQASLLYSRDTAASVAKKIDYHGTSQQLLDNVSVTSKAGEDFVNVTAHGGTGREAAAVANAFAGELVSLINGSQATRIERAIAL